MTLGSGIAVLGVWAAVAVLGYKEPAVAPFVALLAMIATIFIAMAS